MKFSNFFLLISLLFYDFSFGQKRVFDSIINSETDYKEKIKLLDSITSSKYNNFELVLNYSDWLVRQKEFERVIKIRKKLIKYIPKNNYVEYNKNLLILGYYLKFTGKPKESISFYNSILNNNITNIIIFNNDLETLTYYELGKVYSEIYDDTNALKHFKLTISLLKEKKIINKLYVNSCLRIANILINKRGKSNYLKGIYYCNTADSICNKLSSPYAVRCKIYDHLASFYNKDDFLNIKKSLFYYNKALKIAIKNNDVKKEINILHWLGILYNTTNYDKSIKYLDQALKKCSKSDSVKMGKILFSYGLTNTRFKKYELSIESFHESLKLLLGNDLKKLKQIDKNLIINSKHKRKLIEILSNLAETNLKYYTNQRKPKLLNKSLSYFKLTDYTIDLLTLNNSEFKDKLYWRKLSSEIYSKAIKTCYLDDNIKDALFFMEKSKALLLTEDIATQNYRLTLDVSKELLDREIYYKKKLSIINQMPNLNSNNPLLKLKIDIQRKLHTFQDSIYKGRNSHNIEPKILTVKDIQNNLSDKEVFIEYHISKDDGYGIYTNKENGYVIFIAKENKYLFEINNLSNLKKQITTLISSLKIPLETEQDINNFRVNSFNIYKQLFPTKKIRALLKNKKIIISPDSYLTLVPFESLITKKENIFTKSNYLIKDCSISYLYSYSFLKNSEVKYNNKTSFLGFAPTNFKNKKLTSLNNSKEEILNLSNYYNGKTYYNQKATKNTFLQELPNHNIIHLATHANAQDSIEPWIAFYDKKITLPELYLTKNKASLVVLSGCNTTLGKQEVGEGVMSLARGFFYSGAQSVVSSLWSVDDASTSYIMNEFYKNLYKSQTKSEALHNAKLTYLENHSLSELSPHYWASFILLGKDDIILHSAFNWYPYIFGFILLIIIYFIYCNFLKK